MFKYLFFLLVFLPIFVNAKILDIPFISQVPPGNWEETLNCGQTSYYMADKFLSNDSSLNSEGIKKIDDFLFEKFKDPIRNYNGYYTNTTKLKSIAEDFDEYENVFISRLSNDFEKIKNNIENNELIIPLVKISMKIYGDGHFMLMTGFDNEYVYFNDPGKTFGKNKKYLIKDFLDVWKSQNYAYLVLKNNTKEDVLIEEITFKDNEIISIDNNEINDLENQREDIFLPQNLNINKTITFTPIYQPTQNSKNLFLSNTNSESIVINSSNLPNINNSSGNLNFVNNDLVDVSGYGYGYGYGALNENELNNSIKNEEVGGSSNIYLPDFNFKINYKDKKLVIPLEFDFSNVVIDGSKYYFDADFKINKNGEWQELFRNYNMNYYKYYVKTNGDEYYFRIRVCDLNKNCSAYKELFQKVYIEPTSDKLLIGYDGSDVVLDRPEYFNICFDIEPDQVFLIKKGTKIVLTPGCILNIKGVLLAMGEENERIIFTSPNDHYSYWWAYFDFQNSYGSYLNYVDFTNGGGYHNQINMPFVYIDNSMVTINNSTFYDYMGYGGGIYVKNNSAFYLFNSKIKKTMYALFLEDSIGVVENNIFEDNIYGVRLYNVNQNLKFTNNKITKATAFNPITGGNIFADIRDNLFLDNYYNVINQDYIDLRDPGEYTLPKDTYFVKNIFIGKDVTLNILPGTVFKFYPNKIANINIYGSIKSIGTSANPIVFTSVYDDKYGIIARNHGVTPYMNSWIGFKFLEGSSDSVFKNSIFRFSGEQLNYETYGALDFDKSNNISIENCFFDNNFYGINIKNSSNISIKNSTFKDNFYSIKKDQYSININKIDNFLSGNLFDNF